MSGALSAVAGAFCETVPLVCFHALLEHGDTTDTQLCAYTHIELRKIRAALFRLHEVGLAQRVGQLVNGMWTVDRSCTLTNAQRRLHAIDAHLKANVTQRRQSDYVCTACHLCWDTIELLDQMQTDAEPVCPQCRAQLSSHLNEEDDEVVRRQLDALTSVVCKEAATQASSSSSSLTAV